MLPADFLERFDIIALLAMGAPFGHDYTLEVSTCPTSHQVKLRTSDLQLALRTTQTVHTPGHWPSTEKNDTKNLVRAWSWNERAIIARVIARSRTFRRTTPDHTSGTPSQISGRDWNAGSAVELPLRRDLTKADRSISCGSCNVFCAC